VTGTAVAPLLAGVEIEVRGTGLDPDVAARLVEARVDQHRRLPDRCTLRFADPRLDLIDRDSFPLGAELAASFTAPGGTAATSLFTGPIATLEPEFDRHEAILTVRAYDASHRLDQTRRTAAYQQMSYGAIARRIAGQNSLGGRKVADAGGPVPFVQQSNETDWEFLWRLAEEIGFVVGVEGRDLVFAAAAPPSGGTPKRIEWGKELLAFRPRATAVQQVSDVTVRAWDPATARPVEASATAAASSASIGVQRSAAVTASGGGTVTVADRPLRTAAQATALAQGVAGRLGDTFVEAEGTVVGDPALGAGAKVRVEGVGTRFGGTYALSSATHVVRGGRGYETRFTVSARAGRSLRDLASARTERPWRHGCVVGVVTNNNDPEGLGRVRVRYPVLGSDHEGWWARVTAPAAGTRRGLLMVPQTGDEVLLAFEHDDDEHPYVVGSVWNGTAKPQELARLDGSFALRSDKQVVVEAADAMSLTSDKTMTFSSAGNAKLTTSERSGDGPPGNVNVEAKGATTVKAGTDVKVEGGKEVAVNGGGEIKVAAGSQVTIQGGGSVSLKAGGALEIQATGVVRISGSQIMLG
jgi:phage protein D